MRWRRSSLLLCKVCGTRQEFFSLFEEFLEFIKFGIFAAILSLEVIELLLGSLVLEHSLVTQFLELDLLVYLEVFDLSLQDSSMVRGF